MGVLVVSNQSPSLQVSRTQPVIVIASGLLAPSGVATVSSVGLTVPPDLSVSGSPVTSSGTLAISRNTQSANQFLAGPSSGAAAVPAYRAIVAGDIPQLTGAQMPALTGDVTSAAGTAATTLAASGVTAGSYGSGSAVPVLTLDAKGRVTAASTVAVVSGTGTVTSVGLSDLTGLFTITGSPVTAAGNLTISALASQAANTFLAAPSGAAGAPTMRMIVPADVPVFVASGASHAAGAVPDPGATAGTTRFLREDATWATPAGGSSSGGDLPAPSLATASCYWVAGLIAGNASFTNVSGGGANGAVLFPFRVPKAISITKLGFYNATISGAAACGIYNDNGGIPGTLLVAQPQTAVSAGGLFTGTVSATLQPNTDYWALIGATAAGNVQGIYANSLSFNLGVLPPTTVYTNYTTPLSSGWSALPSTLVGAALTPQSSPYLPCIYFK